MPVNKLKLVPDSDPVLHQPAPEVAITGSQLRGGKSYPDFGAEVIAELSDMYDLMKMQRAIGIAAPQVGLAKRMCIVAVGHDVHFMINPKITFSSGIKQTALEGCLSYPGQQAKVSRSLSLVVEFYDRSGIFHKLRAQGLLARCIAHEVDHLDGIVMHDRVSVADKRQAS